MKRILRVILYALGGILAALLLLFAVVFLISGSHMNKTWEVTPETVAIPTDSASIELGRHIASTRGCTDCHGVDFGSAALMDNPATGRIIGSNLTSGEGGIGSSYSDEDWVRAIRHGVAPDGKPLIFMPSYEYYYLSDTDLGALIAYLKGLPPVDRTPEPLTVGPALRMPYAFGNMPTLIPAEMIDHEAARPESPPPGVTLEYGAYLAVGCTGCHGQYLAGQRIPGAPPSWPPASNLTQDEETGIAGWTEEDFLSSIRTGIRPDGTEISEVMPWKQFAQMKQMELDALWLYIEHLEPRAWGNN